MYMQDLDSRIVASRAMTARIQRSLRLFLSLNNCVAKNQSEVGESSLASDLTEDPCKTELMPYITAIVQIPYFADRSVQ